MTVFQNLVGFFLIALVAVFIQNAVFTRGFGVSRLVKLVGDPSVDSMIFCALLCLVLVLAAPLGYLVNLQLAQSQYWFRDYIQPLALVLCSLIAFGVVLAIVVVINPTNKKDLLAVLPLATFNCAVLGPLLITGTQNYSFVETMGFAFGSGLGYALAVLIVGEGQRKLNNRNVPTPFRGLPVNLLYIGILALAIFGLTGHRLAI